MLGDLALHIAISAATQDFTYRISLLKNISITVS